MTMPSAPRYPSDYPAAPGLKPLLHRAGQRARSGLALLALTLTFAGTVSAAVLAGWDVHGSTNYGASPLTATVTDGNITTAGLVRGSGVGTSGTAASRAWGGNAWQSADAASAASSGDYASFTVTPATGYQVSFSAISKLDYRCSTSGPASGVLQYQLGSGTFTNVSTLSYTCDGSAKSLAAISLSGVAGLQNVPAGTTVTFRIVNYGGSNSSGTWYIYDTSNSTANDLEISGTTSIDTGTVNGNCGNANGQSYTTAPTSNLCSAGTASAVTGSGPWAWSCAGKNGGTSASCSASKANGGPFTIFHVNDIHARLTPHKWQIPSKTGTPVFEDVGGAAFLAGKMLALTANQPNSLVIDAGDISEGNPVGDMNGNGGVTQFYTMLSNKLKAVSGRNGRGMDAVVVGNHDVRDATYIANLDALKASGVPVLSVNVRDIATHQPHFAPYNIVTVNGTRVGIIGYTTAAAEVGASLSTTMEVVDCDWSGTSAPCHLSDYVNELRNNQHVDVVVLAAHIGHSALVDPDAPILVDNGVAKLPEVAITGHWHTWTDTVWQPYVLNYKTLFAESSSYMKYIGELNVSATGAYISAAQHVLRNAEITPDADIQTFINGLVSQYDASHTIHANDVVGYTADNLMLDNDMRWWSPDEYPWSGNNTAGQWITDAMRWKCAQLFGACDLAVEAGGGVRADIPAGPVTYMQIYETFPWSDDTFVRIDMSGQDIINFLKETNLDAGFSSALDVTAVDGIPTSVKFNGQPIDVNHIYSVAINNYMLAHPPSGYTWPTHSTALTAANSLVRDGIVEFMQSQHGDAAHPYQVGGARYHFNGEYAGGYRAVVTMMNDNDTKPTYEDAFIRLLSATPETLLRRGSVQVPADLVNADGSVNPANRLSSQELYRSYLGFKAGALVPGDIIETWGKTSFFGGNPEFVDQEGVYGDGIEFKIVGHDASLAKPEFMGSIKAFLNDNYKNHYVKFLARKTAADTVTDQNSQSLKIWDATAYAAAALPGNVGDTLEISGVLTMKNYGFRFRRDSAVVSAAALPNASGISSRMDPLVATASSGVTLSASAAISGGGYVLSPVADAQVESGVPGSNFGSSNNLFLQSSSTSTYGNERGWLKFDLSSIPVGSTITGATLQLWNWRSAGAAMPVEVRGIADDSWTESGLTWNNQPALGNVLDTQTLASGVSNVWYGWNVTAFVQSQWSGDKSVSLMLKPVTEGSADTTVPSYGFDAKEFGSNAPMLQISTQATATAVGSVRFFYRYSADNATWGAWTQTGAADTAAPYTTAFNFPNGSGYYEFYSMATDNLGNAEPTPAYAQTAVHYQAASGQSQTISFGTLSPVPVGSSFSVAATATSGLVVTFSSQTASVCTVANGLVTTLTAGTCTIAADQAGDLGYWQAAATVTQSFAVTALSQTISFGAIGNQVLGTAPFPVSVSASSGLPITLVSLTTNVCVMSGNTVTLLTTGTCTLNASQAGDGTYAAAADVSRSFIVATGSTGNADADVPLPLWALAMLAAGLTGVMQRARRTS